MSIVAGVLLLVGSLLALLAGLGLARFPDTLSRLQAATKLQAAGMTALLVAAALLAEDTGEVAVLVLVGLAFVITVPVLSQVIARAAHRANEQSDRES